MSDAQVRVATANEALSAMKQASPVRPHGAQRNSCSGVVDTAASLQQAKFSEAPTQPLSPDRQQSGGVGATRSPPVSEPGALASFRVESAVSRPAE